MTTGYQYTIREMQMVLVAAALASFLSPFLGSMVNVAIPAIGEAYVATAESLAMLSTAYLISSVMFMVPAARIADILGRKKNISGRNFSSCSLIHSCAVLTIN